MTVESAPPPVFRPAEGGRDFSSLRHRVGRLTGAATRETKLAQLGLVIIAVHVIDDNFVQPQPGTSPDKHLVSGLIPIRRKKDQRHTSPTATPMHASR